MDNYNPVSPDYVPYYGSDEQELDRLARCLQQQVEDCFTTISRIQAIKTADRSDWQTVRQGLRCWRIALSKITRG